MACVTVPKPSRTRRTVLAMGLEKQTVSGNNITTCTRVQGLEQISLYENFNPVAVRGNFIEMNRAKNGLSPEGGVVGTTTYELSGSVYMVGSGYQNVPPPWSKVFRACGFKETRYVLNSGAPTLDWDALDGSDATDDIQPSQHTGSYVQADQVGLTEASAYRYRITYYDAADAIPRESQGSTAVALTLTGVNDSIKFDFTVALQSGGGLWNSGESRPYTWFAIYRSDAGVTPDGTTTFYHLQGRYLSADVVDGSHSLDGATAYEVFDNIHDNDLVEPYPTETATAALTKEVVWRPYNEFHDSLTIQSFLDHGKYVSTGTRGGINFSGAYGEPFRGDFTLQGVYTEPVTGVDNPAMLSNPGVPPLLENIHCVITTRTNLVGGSASVCYPLVKSIGKNIENDVQERGDANSSTAVREYLINGVTPTISMQVEVNGDHEWIKWWKNNEKFRVEFYIHPDAGAVENVYTDTDASDLIANGTPGTRFHIVAGGGETALSSPGSEDRYCQLQSEPTFDDSNGTRVVNLEFTAAGRDVLSTNDSTDNFLFLRQF